MEIADNKIARQYDELQNSINWISATDSQQIECMNKIIELLKEVPNNTPIFDFRAHNMKTGEPIVTNAIDQLDYVITRRNRLSKRAAQ